MFESVQEIPTSDFRKHVGPNKSTNFHFYRTIFIFKKNSIYINDRNQYFGLNILVKNHSLSYYKLILPQYLFPKCRCVTCCLFSKLGNIPFRKYMCDDTILAYNYSRFLYE